MDATVLEDELYARQKGYQFEVATKESKHARWITVYDKISSLIQAFDLAKNITAYDVAIFLIGENSNTMYWKAKFPVYNSTVINSERRYD